MGKIILHIASSIDGMIADECGGVEWLDDFLRPQEDYGMGSFFKTVDSCIMGSKTYEQTLSFNYWYKGMAGYIFTSRQLRKLEGEDIHFKNGDPTPLVNELRQHKKDIWLIGGASLVTEFINKDLLDEMVITMVPKILGKGIPLFQGIQDIQNPELIATKPYPDGVVQLTYRLNQ
jgi:dihydrofolate reductase